MFDKNIILLIVLILLFVFYLVIRLGAGNKKNIDNSKHLSKYLGGVRILILILGCVGIILWFFI